MYESVIRCPRCGESRHVRLQRVYVNFDPAAGTGRGGHVSETPLVINAAWFACGHVVDDFRALVQSAQAELQAEYEQQLSQATASRQQAQAESLERARMERERLAAEVVEQARQKAEQEAQRQAAWEADAPARAVRDQAENDRLRALEETQRRRDAKAAQECQVDLPENAFLTDEQDRR